MPGSVFLRGDGVDLHPVDEEDLPFLQRAINDPDVWPHLSRASPATMRDEHRFYEEVVHAVDEEHLIIVSVGEPVGIIGLRDIDPTWGNAELGYFLTPEQHGHGYATEAVRLVTDWAFDHRRLAKILAWVMPSNEASIRVLEKNDYTEEGTITGFAFVDGERRDMCIYGRSAPWA